MLFLESFVNVRFESATGLALGGPEAEPEKLQGATPGMAVLTALITVMTWFVR